MVLHVQFFALRKMGSFPYSYLILEKAERQCSHARHIRTPTLNFTSPGDQGRGK